MTAMPPSNINAFSSRAPELAAGGHPHTEPRPAANVDAVDTENLRLRGGEETVSEAEAASADDVYHHHVTVHEAGKADAGEQVYTMKRGCSTNVVFWNAAECVHEPM